MQQILQPKFGQHFTQFREKNYITQKNIAFVLFFCFFSLASLAQTNHAELQKKYNNHANKYLIKQDELRAYFDISAKGVATFASAKDKKLNKAECFIFWDELNDLRNLIMHADTDTQLKLYLEKGAKRFSKSQKEVLFWAFQSSKYAKSSTEKPLFGKKIAIDPGHIAGDMEMAKLESRFIEIPINQKTYTFFEGDLTLTTALLLKKKLENAGAEVLLTRNAPNQTASGKTYKKWLAEELPKVLHQYVKEGLIKKEKMTELLKKPYQKEIYETYFLHEDFRDRMRAINKFNPDISFVIHYNADAEKKVWNKPTERNYSMTFVPGAFLKNELQKPEDRMAFLKLLLLGNLEKSINLATIVQQEFETTLSVPAIPQKNNLAYLNRASIYVDKGVYARNLGLCRLINSPIAYGESMYQDCTTEIKALHTNSTEKPALRVQQVAEAYFQAALRYFK
jgi:N-acetylmuramoyl-L-alanine amidase